MKRLFIALAASVCLSSAVFAADGLLIDYKDTVEIQRNIATTGFKILNSNGIEKRTVFRYDNGKAVNAHSAYRDREIVMYRGLYSMLDSEEELAAILSHEISHSIDSYDGILRGYFSYVNNMCCPKKYEYKADKRAVDYMVNAGYNPVALIVTMSKAFPQERYDWCSTHPLTSRRMMEIYEYIYKKYPEYLVNNKYKNNIYYQNFLLTSKTNRAKFQNKIETKSKGKVSYL